MRGQWDVTLTGHPGYRGVVLIDAERRVTVDSPDDNGKPAQFRGYVRDNGMRAEMITTNGKIVTPKGRSGSLHRQELLIYTPLPTYGK